MRHKLDTAVQSQGWYMHTPHYFMFILGQVRLSKGLPCRVRKGIRMGPRKLEPSAGAINRKNILLTYISIILDPEFYD